MASAVFLAPVSPSMEQSFMELVACLCRFQRDPAVRAVSSMLLLCATVSAIPTYSLPWWAALSAAAWVVTPIIEQTARVEPARAQDSVRPTTSRPPPRSPRSQHGSAAGTTSHAHPEHSAGHISQAPPHRSRSRARGRSPRVTQGLPLADVLQPAAPHQHASPTFPETQPGENPATLTVERDDGLVSLRLIDHTANGDLYPPTGVVRSHDSVHGDAAVLTLERLDGLISVRLVDRTRQGVEGTNRRQVYTFPASAPAAAVSAVQSIAPVQWLLDAMSPEMASRDVRRVA